MKEGRGKRGKKDLSIPVREKNRRRSRRREDYVNGWTTVRRDPKKRGRV